MSNGSRGAIRLCLVALFLAAAPTAHAVPFSNPAAITITDAVDPGMPPSIPSASTPYPSAVGVSGVVGTVTKVTATLHGFHHTCSEDVDMLLVGPHGQESILMSDAGACVEGPAQPAPIELTFDDAGPAMPCLAVPNELPSGSYRPTNDPTSPADCTSDPDVFNPPAPAGPYPLGLAAFNGVDPNGVWNLYTMDQHSGDSGAIDGGWTLDLTIPAGTLASPPSITGKSDVGKRLTAASGTLGNGAAAAYRWNRCNAAGKRCAAIAGAVAGTYRPKAADRGHTLIVSETAVTSGGKSAPLASKATHAVGPAVISSAGTKKSQNVLAQKGLLASLKSNIAGSLVASATVSVPSSAKTVRFKTAKKKLKAGKKTRVKLKLSSGSRNAIVGALGRGVKLKAKLRLIVTDSNGVKSSKRLSVKLKA